MPFLRTQHGRSLLSWETLFSIGSARNVQLGEFFLSFLLFYKSRVFDADLVSDNRYLTKFLVSGFWPGLSDGLPLILEVSLSLNFLTKQFLKCFWVVVGAAGGWMSVTSRFLPFHLQKTNQFSFPHHVMNMGCLGSLCFVCVCVRARVCARVGVCVWNNHYHWAMLLHKTHISFS